MKTTYFGTQEQHTWLKWLHIFDRDNDGDLDIVGDGLFGDIVDSNIFWRNDNGKFNGFVQNKTKNIFEIQELIEKKYPEVDYNELD